MGRSSDDYRIPQRQESAGIPAANDLRYDVRSEDLDAMARRGDFGPLSTDDGKESR